MAVNRIDATGGGTVADAAGENVITAGSHAATVTASLGTDTILGGSGALLVDAGEDYADVTIVAGAGPLDFLPGEGTSSVTGGSGRVTVEAGYQGFQGALAYAGGTGAATVTGYIDTTVTGGTSDRGTVLFLQNGPATVVGGTGTVTVYTDGNQLTVEGPGGAQATTWMPDTHIYLQVTETASGLQLVQVNGIDGTAGGAVADTLGSNWITLGNAAATVTATLGTDTIVAGGGDLVVNAAADAHPLVIDAGAGALAVRPGSGTLRIVDQGGSVAVAAYGAYWTWAGPAGDTLLLDHDSAGLVRITDTDTGAVSVIGPAGIFSGTGSVTAAAVETLALLAGEGGSLLYAVLARKLGLALPAGSQYVGFAAGQAVPSGSNTVAGMTIPTGGTAGLTVPAGVGIVLNRLAGNSLQGNGAANQFVMSSTGFTYHANGGSGAIVADDVQAAGRAGNNHIVLGATGGDFAIATGSGDDTVEASSGNDTVAAGAGSNVVWLGTGADLVYAAGYDTVVSGSGAVTVDATASYGALVFGGPGMLRFIGGAGAATVVAGSGRASLTGGSGDTVFWGSSGGYTTIQSGAGNGTLVGGADHNLIYAGGSHDELLVAGLGGSSIIGAGATGNNFYWGSHGDDLLVGDAGNDTIIGGPGHDTIAAGSGTDLIFGGGDGVIYKAGAGARDTTIVTGGGAPDTFVVANGQAGGRETIWGFRPGVDHLSLQGYDPGTLGTALSSSYTIGASTGIVLPDGSTIIFGNVTGLTVSLLS